MAELLFGSVKFFKSEDGKRFGFIEGDDGVEYFFHFNAGKTFSEENGAVVWAQKVTRDPERGDRVAFEVSAAPGNGNTRAKPWGFEADMRTIETRIGERAAA